MSDTAPGAGPENFDFVWRPHPELVAGSNLAAFMERVGAGSLEELQRRSTEDVGWFTERVIEFLDIRFARPWEQILDLSRGMPFARWCVGGGLNIVESCLDKWLADPETARRTALIAEDEEGAAESLTYGELADEVGRCANALRSLGLGKGDVVGLYMPMSAEIVIALFAAARIGAILLPLFSGFGAGAVADRLNDAGARALITADGTRRRGRPVPLKETADEALRHAPGVQHVVVVRHLSLPGESVEMAEGRDHWWHELLAGRPQACEAEPTAAEDVLMLIYTSGTTGRPKGAVHTHCGFPIKAAQDMCFGTDVRPGDVVHWVTDMGWMMGPWLVFGTALLGATCVLYDGAPDYPGPDRLWRLVETQGIGILGLSPTLVRSLIPHGEEPVKTRDLSSLRLFASTGEPWNPAPWNWLFAVAGESRLPIVNYSGGTEISGGILMGNLLQPSKPTAFSGPCPGMAADVAGDDGEPLRGEVGELVVRAPWIGMTRGFWNDEERYLQTYWSRWPDVWVHGDWAAVDGDACWYILGRSDDIILVAGKRLGPAEYESILVDHPAVVEAGAVGVPHPVKGTDVVCFCVPVAGMAADAELKRELLDRVAAELGKPMRPGDLLFVPDLPKTRNAKVMRRVIRSAWLGEDPGDTSSLVNPEAIAAIAGAAAGNG